MGQPDLEPTTTADAAEQIESMLPDFGLWDSDEQPEPEEQEQEGEETPETDESDDESVEDSEEESDDEESESESETEDEEHAQIESVADLAEALGVPVEELSGTLKHRIKVDGVESEVTLSELVSGYQKDADYRRKTSEVAEQRKTLDSQARQLAEWQESQLLQLGRYVQEAEKLFSVQYSESELSQLRQTDPGEYAARMNEKGQRQQQLNALKQSAAQTFAQVQQIRQQQQQAQMQQALQKAAEELPSRIPSWSKDTAKALDEYLMGDRYGYSAEDLQQIADARLVEIAHKAMLYDQQAKTTDVAKKKVKTLPKLQRSAKPEGKVSVKTSQLTKAKQRLAKTGRTEDAAAIIEQFL